MFIVKAILFIWHVNTVEGCLVIQVLTCAPSGNYITGILFIYVDIYVSLKKMAIGHPAISTRLAVVMVILSWLFWLALGVLGFSMRNKHYVYDHNVGCFLHNGSYVKEYILVLCVFYLSVFVAVFIFHFMTYRLITRRKAFNESLRVQVNTISGQETNEAVRVGRQRMNWQKNDSILKLVLLVLVMFSELVSSLCHNTRRVFLQAMSCMHSERSRLCHVWRSAIQQQ